MYSFRRARERRWLSLILVALFEGGEVGVGGLVPLAAADRSVRECIVVV